MKFDKNNIKINQTVSFDFIILSFGAFYTKYNILYFILMKEQIFEPIIKNFLDKIIKKRV